MESRSEDIAKLRKRWDERAERYDSYYEDLAGAIDHYVDWEVLKEHLPENSDAKILDAAGGTGRITLPLAKMGYSVTLCDISPGMLNVARRKLLKEGVLDKVEIVECDVRRLRFADETFDFSLGWNGMIESARELIRVTKKGGKVSIFLVNRCGDAISRFREDPDAALALLSSRSDHVYYDDEKYMVFSEEEARKFFAKEGIRAIDIYALCWMLEFLSIPETIRKSRSWDEKYFEQVAEMVLRLSKEPSVRGLARHLALYGEKM
jgi:ubiquinone/menaquinone biosynthesis C-methylase UbiE